MRCLTASEPCPGRIVLDAGAGFATGAVGGSLFHLIKGIRASPNGARIAGGLRAVRMNAPRVGGSFAAWAGLFSAFNCAAVYLRQKEDPWNSIVGGAATGGLLSVRRGLGAVTRSAVFSGTIFALFEGLGVTLANDRAQAAQQNPPQAQVDHAKLAAAVASRLHAAQQNLPVEETKRPNDNGGEF